MVKLSRDKQFAKFGIRPRKKGERRDPYFFDDLFTAFQSLLHKNKRVAKFKVIGKFDGFDPDGSPCVYDSIVITTTDGLLVPCCRVSSKKNDYAICELNWPYKAGKVK